MKIQRILILCGAVLAIVSSKVGAQDRDQIPVPGAPYLAHVPASGHWTITLKYPSHAPAPSASAVVAPPPQKLNADQPVSIDTVKSGNVSLMTYTFQGSSPVSVDRDGNYYFMRTSSGLRMYGSMAATPFTYVTDGFLFAEWVRQEGLSAFKGIIVYRGVQCFYYQNAKPPNPEGYDPNYGEEAWIDVKTMLPVAAKQSGVEADFQFHSAPDSTPEIPRDEIAMIQARENAVKAISALR